MKAFAAELLHISSCLVTGMSWLQRCPGYRDVPHVAAAEDIPAGLPSQAHPSGVPPGSLDTHLCHTSIPPYRPSGQEDLSSDPALKSCCHQGVPFPLQWKVVAVPSLPFQWIRNSITSSWASALGRALSPWEAHGSWWSREFSPAAGTKAAQAADVDSKLLSFPLSGQAPGRTWFTKHLMCIYQQEKSSLSLGITVFLKNVTFMSPSAVSPH